jgi:Kdo2-lipid IVA lauroyltransferase/acyltransferase
VTGRDMPKGKERRAAITWLMPLGTLIQFMLPRWVVVRIARPASVLVYHLNRKGRERLMDNCRHILGPGTPESEIRATTRRLFFHYVLNVLDLMRVPVMKRRVAALVDMDTLSVDRMMSENRGIVVVTAHMGNYDLAGVYMAARGYPMSAVVEPVPGGWAKTYDRYRGATAMETIPIPDRRAMIRALHRHRMLALVSDRDLTGNGLLCPSFDSHRYFPKGAAAYTLRLKTALLVAGMVFQHEPGRPPYRMVYKQLDFTPTGDMDADVNALTCLIAAEINDLIRRFPDQWLVFNAKWQQKP